MPSAVPSAGGVVAQSSGLMLRTKRTNSPRGIVVVLFLLYLSGSLVYSQWSTNPLVNNAVCASIGSQAIPQMVSDGAGGAIIAWQDSRFGGTLDIFAQRVNAYGGVVWGANGVAICAALYEQNTLQLVSDGAGGAIIVWQDSRGGLNYDVYAQRVNAAGAVQWATDGVAICTSTNAQLYPQLAGDGLGGAIIAWQDSRSGLGYDIYAQRVNASGAVQWTANGVAICTATGDQQFCSLIGDGAGGAFIAWNDLRSGVDIYAQRVNGSGVVQWTANGAAMCTALSNQMYPQLVDDRTGGAIITWQDDRGGSFRIYAQRFYAWGGVRWATNGVAICTALAGDQGDPQLVADGAGGAIITWTDSRSGSGNDIYAQRVSSAGGMQWGSSGVAICAATGTQGSARLAVDGTGGAVISWQDYRLALDYDVYVQRVNALGIVQWAANGVAVSMASGSQANAVLVGDGTGGSIVVWVDGRSGYDDIYAQAVDGSGRLGYPPKIADVRDIPNDQGGCVALLWDHSHLDVLPTSYVSGYEIYRGYSALVANASYAVLGEREYAEQRLAGMTAHSYLVKDDAVNSGGPIYWEYVSAITAKRLENYASSVVTLSDSGPQGNSICYYMVRAYYTSNIFWDSAPDSAYSVDNLAPATPVGPALALVAANTVKVSWNPDRVDPDLGCYDVYRSGTSSFVPSSLTLLGTTQDTLYLDNSAGSGVPYYYRVTAVDIHGNQSTPTPELSFAFPLSIPAGWSLVGLPGNVPNAYYHTVYPAATAGTLYRFSGTYLATDTLQPGAGFWLKFPSAATVNTLSVPVQSSTVSLAEGWNLIAGPSCALPVGAITDRGGILVAGTVYGFNGGYVSAATLERGRGYWVKARGAGTISMICGAALKQNDGGDGVLADVSAYPTLTVADASGAEQTLYWNVRLKDAAARESYSLPPLPAGRCFDARFAGDYRLTEGLEGVITIQTDHYPLTIAGTNVPVGGDARYSLVEMEGSKEGISHPLVNGATIEIQNAGVKSLAIRRESLVPLEFGLEQNFPNPFNPSTTIRFSIGDPQFTILKVFDMLGREVAVLVNEKREPGNYTVTWNAGGMASGVYVYRMTAGDRVDSRSMLLLK